MLDENDYYQEVRLMMPGDSYSLSIEVAREKDGSLVTDADVIDIEFTIGHLIKAKAEGVSYDGGTWIFPISQAESFKFPATHVKAQARIAWKNGEIEGVKMDPVCVWESISRREL